MEYITTYGCQLYKECLRLSLLTYAVAFYSLPNSMGRAYLINLLTINKAFMAYLKLVPLCYGKLSAGKVSARRVRAAWNLMNMQRLTSTVLARGEGSHVEYQ